MKSQIELNVEELEERIAPDVLGGGNPAQTANPENTAIPRGARFRKIRADITDV
jgi:hypothetical protein